MPINNLSFFTFFMNYYSNYKIFCLLFIYLITIKIEIFTNKKQKLNYEKNFPTQKR